MPQAIKVGLLTHAPGAHVTAYLSALAKSAACGEVVLADPGGRWEKEARKVLGDKLTQVYPDHKTLLERDRPGMVLVTMEAKLAPPVIDAALEAGCHVFAEKPSCIRVEDFEPLVHKADSGHRNLMLALANRLNPEIAAARRMIANGVIGKIYGMEMHLVADQTRLTRESYQQQWFAHKDRAGGGHLIWLGIHWLDLAMDITQSSVTEVAGFTANVGGQSIDVEDSAAAALKFDNGTLGTLTSGYYLDKGYNSHIKIWGSGGWLHLESMKDEPLTWYTAKGAHAGEVQTWQGSKQPRGYTPFVDAAIKACAEMTDPPISNADSLRALKTVFAIYKAAATGRTVQV
ncbi:putative oxidoreductase YcjS [Symmachiella dynata]|uniref:Putative oxidoreductase YcjS n=1 Tax=Symmachiella dynata TaxID=2527995 RepID=A0A517ZHQ9_9PLAN|nr:Gfo/Idh/MocA family oxidoreductase [Symmachiella dynata]QDU42018.1 putative oxidoreductase YcjS [Symmachiella dynata]